MAHSPRVLLVHGFLMRSPCMWPLGAMLRHRGWRVSYFGYPSTRESTSEVAVRLARLLTSERIEHVVGHSLGGVLALRAANLCPALRGRIVSLGSPHRGSVVGRSLHDWPLVGGLFRSQREAWCEGMNPTEAPGWELGTIIGTVKVGAGLLILPRGGSHDGVVAEDETLCGDAQRRVWVRTSHSGLILSGQVAELADHFLTHGTFQPLQPV